jgi:hypothetical protein
MKMMIKRSCLWRWCWRKRGDYRIKSSNTEMSLHAYIEKKSKKKNKGSTYARD